MIKWMSSKSALGKKRKHPPLNTAHLGDDSQSDDDVDEAAQCDALRRRILHAIPSCSEVAMVPTQTMRRKGVSAEARGLEVQPPVSQIDSGNFAQVNLMNWRTSAMFHFYLTFFAGRLGATRPREESRRKAAAQRCRQDALRDSGSASKVTSNGAQVIDRSHDSDRAAVDASDLNWEFGAQKCC